MKKVLFLLLMVAAFVACSDDEDDTLFSDKQKEILSVLNKGNFVNYEEFLGVIVSNDTLFFTETYKTPIKKTQMVLGEKFEWNIHGECVYSQYISSTSRYRAEMYYTIDWDGNFIQMYHKNEEGNLGMSKTYDIKVQSNDKFILHDRDLGVTDQREFIRIK